MAHAHESNTKRIWVVFGILSIITIVEVLFGIYKPKSLYSWCTRVLYNKRSNFDPLWNRLVIGGVQDGQTYN